MNDFSEALLSWYRSCRRILPWREDPTPYHVWLSEIMLQQTRVDTVIGYYERFLKVLPDVQSLAEAEEETCLKLWQGLGYYSRVRNFQKAAVKVMEQYDGNIPGTVRELSSLNGIGPYTAAAIASIAFGVKAVSVDGNLLRIYLRLNSCALSAADPAVRKSAEQFFLARMPEEGKGKPGDFNQALMDIGATICLPNGTPLCGECPLAAFCGAHAQGRETDYPSASPKTERKRYELTVLLLETPEGVLLHKRPEKGLLAGLWEFPNSEGRLSEIEVIRWLSAKGLSFCTDREKADALSETGKSAADGAQKQITELPDASHIFTHLEWRMRGYRVRFGTSIPDEILKRNGWTAAAPRELKELYSVPAAFRTYLKEYLSETKTEV